MLKNKNPNQSKSAKASMTISKHKNPQYSQEHEHEEEEEEDYSTESGGSGSDNDSDTDPSYSIIEETRSKLSSLLIKKKSKSRVAKDLVVSFEKDPGEIQTKSAEVDEKSYEEVQKIIQAGKLERLKVEQCKVYLRKNELRLTGKKDTLLQRIKEHQEILNGGGEKRYPIPSFVLNCKGDACRGDVVMFKQNIYEMYNIASRSAHGPPCGTRMVAGRIVKESYGAAKQQHTFTIEVLWSKGEKPLPPLHPLLIKGRNLYRLKTLRQRWEDEGERLKVLLEKHSRGSLARSNRETRIQEKERRKMLREKRALKKEETNKSHSQLNPKLKTNMGIQGQLLCSSVNLGTAASQPQQTGLSVNLGTLATRALKKEETNKSCSQLNPKFKTNTGIQAQQSGSFVNLGIAASKPQQTGLSFDSGTLATRTSQSAANGVGAQKQAIQTQHSGLSTLSAIPQQPAYGVKMKSRPEQPEIQPQNSELIVNRVMAASGPQQLSLQPQQSNVLSDSVKPIFHVAFALDLESRKRSVGSDLQKNQRENQGQFSRNPVNCSGIQDVQTHKSDDSGSPPPNLYDHHSHFNFSKYPFTSLKDGLSQRDQRQPLKCVDHFHPMRSPHRQGCEQPKLHANRRENDYHNQVPGNSVKYGGIQDVEQQQSDHFGSRSPNFHMNEVHSRFNKHHCTSWKDGNNHSQPLTVSHNHYRPMIPPPPHRKPLTNMNRSCLMRSPHREGYQQVQLCRYFAQGRCHYGDNCKFLHELRKERDQKREERLPTSPGRLEGRPYLF